MRRKTFFVTMLAIAVLAMNVFATTAEAGALGSKPSVNQGVAQPSGNIANTANAVKSVVGYDTVKYQYPAQQLKAEGKNFDRYNWRLFLRFDTGELMVQDWVASMNWQIREYADNTFEQTPGVIAYAFDFRKDFLSAFDREWTWEGFRVSIPDNQLLFVKPDSVGDIAVDMRVGVHVKPQNCYPRGTYIWVTGAQHHNGSTEPCTVYRELYWDNIGNSHATKETIDEYNAKYGHAVMPVKLYYPSVKRALYVSGWCLDDVAKYMPIIDGAYPDANPENGSHYTYLLHYKLRSLPGMKKVF